MSVSTTTDQLFSPFEIGGLHLPNRIVMAADGHGPARARRHLQRRDDRLLRAPRRGRRRDDHDRGEPRLARRLRGRPRAAAPRRGVPPRACAGSSRRCGRTRSRSAIQLWHPGRQTLLGEPIAPVAGAALAPARRSRTSSRGDEIHDARRLLRALGLDLAGGGLRLRRGPRRPLLPAVRVHLAAGRTCATDEYGGSLENRARFPLEIVARDPRPLRRRRTRSCTGSAATRAPRAASRSRTRAGVALARGGGRRRDQRLGGQLVRAAPDDRRRCSCRAATWCRSRAAIKRAVSVPVIAVGRLDDPAWPSRSLADGDADLIAIGRALIADPDWPSKVRRDGSTRSARASPATPASTSSRAPRQARCAVNPEVGRELGWAIVPAATPRRVMVVGSGPAGMEAARIARLRGHDVSIWERDAELGGKLDVASRAPSKHDRARLPRLPGAHASSSSASRSTRASRSTPTTIARRGARRRDRRHGRRAAGAADPRHRRPERASTRRRSCTDRVTVAPGERDRGHRRQRHRLRDGRVADRRGRRGRRSSRCCRSSARDRADHAPAPARRPQAARASRS